MEGVGFKVLCKDESKLRHISEETLDYLEKYTSVYAPIKKYGYHFEIDKYAVYDHEKMISGAEYKCVDHEYEVPCKKNRAYDQSLLLTDESTWQLFYYPLSHPIMLVEIYEGTLDECLEFKRTLMYSVY